MNDWGSPHAMAKLFASMAGWYIDDNIYGMSDAAVEELMLAARAHPYDAWVPLFGLVFLNGHVHDAMQYELLWRQERRENGSPP